MAVEHVQQMLGEATPEEASPAHAVAIAAVERTLTAVAVAERLTSQGRKTNKHTVLSWTKPGGPGGEKTLAFSTGTVAGGTAKLFAFAEVLEYLRTNGLAMPTVPADASGVSVAESTSGLEQATQTDTWQERSQESSHVHAGGRATARKYVVDGDVDLDKVLTDLDGKIRLLLSSTPDTIGETQKFAASTKALFAEVRAMMLASHAHKLRQASVLPRESVTRMLAELAQMFRSQAESLVADVPSRALLALAKAGAQVDAIETACGIAKGELATTLRTTTQGAVDAMLRGLAERFRDCEASLGTAGQATAQATGQAADQAADKHGQRATTGAPS